MPSVALVVVPQGVLPAPHHHHASKRGTRDKHGDKTYRFFANRFSYEMFKNIEQYIELDRGTREWQEGGILPVAGVSDGLGPNRSVRCRGWHQR